MITINISEEKIQTSFNKAIEDLLVPGQYNNPIKKIVEDLLSHYNSDEESKALRIKLKEKVSNFIVEYIDTDECKKAIGEQIAKELAKRALEDKKR